MLAPGRRPEFGVTDWFVEDLVEQGNRVIGSMTAAPAWADDFDGDMRVVPVRGCNPGEHLAKPGRVCMDRHDDPLDGTAETAFAQLGDRLSIGVRPDLESSCIFFGMRDGHVNIPDVFRMGYGLGRRGGVRPVRRTEVAPENRAGGQGVFRRMTSDAARACTGMADESRAAGPHAGALHA